MLLAMFSPTVTVSNNISLAPTPTSLTISMATPSVYAGVAVSYYVSRIQLSDGRIVNRINGKNNNYIQLEGGNQAVRIGKKLYLEL
jgi:hypothetical protein